MSTPITFIAQVKEVKSKTLASGDLGFTVVLQAEDTNALVVGGYVGMQTVTVTVTPNGDKV